MDAVDFPVTVQMEDTRRRDTSGAFHRGLALSPVFAGLRQERRGEGGQSPLCPGTMPSSAGEQSAT